MPNEFNRLAERLSRRTSRMGDRVSQAVRRAAITVDQVVVLMTPVDTGRARSNWIATINIPASGTREPFFSGNNLGLAERANAQASIQAAQTVIATYTQNSTIFITNNLEYIGELERGKSPQAPTGMVSFAIEAGRSTLASVRLLEG